MTIKKKQVLCIFLAVVAVIAMMFGQESSRKSDLRELLDTEHLEESIYTPISYQTYSESLAAAEAVEQDFFASSEEIDSAYSNLQDSIACLQIIPDKTKLQDRLEEAIGVDQSVYIPLSVTPLQEAITLAQQVLSNENAVFEDVNAAAAQIESAVSGLVSRPDKTELTTLLEEAKAVDGTVYLLSTYKNVISSIDLAEEVISDENAVEKDVSDAVKQLTKSLNGLIEKPDKTALGLLIEQAAAFAEEKYITSTYTSLQNALASVKTVYQNAEATHETVSAAEATIQDAINALVKTTKGVFRIAVHFSRESNNHVGNSWSYGAYYNSANIDGQKITIGYGSSISIYCEIIEEDKVPDIGSGYIYLGMEDGAQKSITISVYENRGRYSGNRAVWIVTATATLIERV